MSCKDGHNKRQMPPRIAWAGREPGTPGLRGPPHRPPPPRAAARGSIGAPRGSVCSSTNSLWSVLFLPHPPYYPAVPFLRFLQMTLENKCRSRGGPWCGAPSELRDPDKEAVTRAAHWANGAAEVRKGPRKEHLVWGPKEGSPPPSSWLRFWSVTRSCC